MTREKESEKNQASASEAQPAVTATLVLEIDFLFAWQRRVGLRYDLLICISNHKCHDDNVWSCSRNRAQPTALNKKSATLCFTDSLPSPSKVIISTKNSHHLKNSTQSQQQKKKKKKPVFLSADKMGSNNSRTELHAFQLQGVSKKCTHPLTVANMLSSLCCRCEDSSALKRSAADSAAIIDPLRYPVHNGEVLIASRSLSSIDEEQPAPSTVLMENKSPTRNTSFTQRSKQFSPNPSCLSSATLPPLRENASSSTDPSNVTVLNINSSSGR
ncbi:hypothetical protein FHG87_020386, partial [Trinorchestia longiramus]